MRFERDKLVKWWAQSFPAGVQDIVVGFRDDSGLVRSVQTYKTLQLPRFVAGKPHAWDAKLSLAFAVEVRDRAPTVFLSTVEQRRLRNPTLYTPSVTLHELYMHSVRLRLCTPHTLALFFSFSP